MSPEGGIVYFCMTSFVKKLDSGGYEGDIKKSFKHHDARNRAIRKLKVEDKSSPKEEHSFRMSKTVKRGVARFGK